MTRLNRPKPLPRGWHRTTDWMGQEVGTLYVTGRCSVDHEGRATWFADCLPRLGGCGREGYVITSKHLKRGAANPNPTVPSCGCLQWKRRHAGNTHEAQVGIKHRMTPQGSAAISANVTKLRIARPMKRNVKGQFTKTPKGSKTTGRKEGRPRVYKGSAKERNAAAARARRAKLRAAS